MNTVFSIKSCNRTNIELKQNTTKQGSTSGTSCNRTNIELKPIKAKGGIRLCVPL